MSINLLHLCMPNATELSPCTAYTLAVRRMDTVSDYQM